MHVRSRRRGSFPQTRRAAGVRSHARRPERRRAEGTSRNDSTVGPGPAGPNRVPLVEDHDDTRHLLARLLKSFGCEVMTAARVAEAVALANGQEFDLLLSDIGLP